MTQPALVEFLDSRFGKCSASVGTIEEGVVLALRLGEKPEVAVDLSGPAAVQLAREPAGALGIVVRCAVGVERHTDDERVGLPFLDQCGDRAEA